MKYFFLLSLVLIFKSYSFSVLSYEYNFDNLYYNSNIRFTDNFYKIDGMTRIEESPEIYKKLVESYALIFKTSTGQNILSKTFFCNSDLLAKATGLNKEDASLFLEACFLNEEDKKTGEKLSEAFSFEEKRQLFVLDKECCFDAFTSNEHQTLFAKELFQDKNKNKLLVTLAHELGIYLDSSFQYEFFFINKFEASEMEGLYSFSYSFEHETEKTFTPGMRHVFLKRTERNKIFYDLLEAPVLKSAFSSLRAFDLERKIVNDLAENE